MYLQTQPVVIALHPDSCQLAAGSGRVNLRSCLNRGAETSSSIYPGQATATQLSWLLGSGETNAAEQRQPDKPEAERSGAWVRKVRARRQGVTLYTDSLTDLRAEHVSDSGPNAKRPTDRGLCGRLGHEYHRGTLPCSLPPSQGLSRRVRYSTKRYMGRIRYPKKGTEFENVTNN